MFNAQRPTSNPRPPMLEEPVIDLQSDHYFMGEALRQAAKAYQAEEVPSAR